MESLWSDAEAAKFVGDLEARVYTSRLLGANPELVLHGGGNTSVKTRERDFYGDDVEVLHVKGSGWDLATIEAQGFAPVRMEALVKMTEMDHLTDAEMVKQQRAAMLDPAAPNPSIEAILHAILPFHYVDHTHANAVIAVTNHADGPTRVEAAFGNRVLVVPYVMPGFVLAKAVAERIRDHDLKAEGIEGIVLLNHGIFTFGDDARTSYERMIELVGAAEEYLAAQGGADPLARGESGVDWKELATLRKEVGLRRGRPVLAMLDRSPEAVGYSQRADVDQIATRGPVTPDHSIRTKRIPAVVGDAIAEDVAAFEREYDAYFERNASGETKLDPAPRVAVWKGRGVAAFGTSEREAGMIRDIAQATWETVQRAEATGGWQALGEKEIFEVEYWELEQAKLRKAPAPRTHDGKVAIVSGSAAGIGFACAEALANEGAKVVGFDLNPDIEGVMAEIGGVGKVVNLTEEETVKQAVEETVAAFGGVDVLVSNAGIFTAGAYLEEMDQGNWEKSLAVNLTSHELLLKHTIPYLKLGFEAAIVIVGSRNVKAPGPGAASYSCAKAGLTQLCRVAALELGPEGVRCNIVHPDAVFDTKLWTPEKLARSAERYGLTVDEYKRRNLMRTEIKSREVGAVVSAMAGPLFARTTGAQVPVDGGNDRVI